MKLSKTDIKRVIDSQSYQCGRTYANQGKIFSTKIDENKIIAKCVGSYESNYQLYCHVDDHEVGFGRCSCPVGSEGRCKHIAALLLTWIKDPENSNQ